LALEDAFGVLLEVNKNIPKRWKKDQKEMDEMKFIVECDGSDGLVLMDQSYLGEMDSELLYSMDILLDRHGESELIYDFPSEN